MLMSFLLAAAALLPVPGGTDSARAVVRTAVRAVERDGGATLEAAWRARVAGNPADRAAALGLATLSRLTYDYPDAERRYRALAGAAGAAPDGYATYARLGQADALYERGLMSAADSEYVLARADARRTGDPLAEAEALLGLAFLRANSDGIPTGFALADSAGRLIPDAAPDVRANYECHRGVLDAVLLRPAGVEEAERGAALARRAGAPRLEARCLRAQALAFSLRHFPDTALVLLRRTAALERRARNRSALAETLLRAADILRGRGAFGDAKAAIDEAMAESRASSSQFALASANLNAGALALQLNDRAPAAEYIRRAAAMFAAQGDTSSVMIAHEFLADLDVAAGDYAAARREALETLGWYQRSGEVPRQLEMYQSLATIAMRAHEWEGAARAIADGRALARRHHLPRSGDWMAYQEGRLALYRGDLATAERRFGDYLRERAPDERLHIYEARAHLAEVYARRGDAARAEREMAAATRELDAWRATLGDAELRLLAFQAGAGEEAEADGNVPRVLAALAGAGRADGAFAIAERRRARELADRMVQAGALRATRDDERPAPGAHAEGARPVDAAAAAAALPDDRTALLEYVTGPDGAPTTLFVLARAAGGAPRLRALVLPPADSLAARIERLDALLEGGADPRELERSIGGAVLDPALAVLGPAITRLVIVPDGPLHRLPFHALRLTDGRYAVERFAIGIVPSASVLVELWKRGRPAADSGKARVLAFGDPAYLAERDSAARGAASGYRSAFEDAGGLSRLTESAREARLVAAYAPGSMVRLREAASAAYLEHAPLAAFDVIHFATHALVDDERMGRSALALSPGGGESGFVTPGDLAALRLRADLVVLSACRTAGGVIVTGEGVQGLTAPLLRAGARAVVATGWRIDDRRTVGFVRRFYDALARGEDVAAALRASQIEAIRSGAPPRDWAAFEVVGDPLVRVPLVAPPRFPAAPGIIALSAVLALAVGIALAISRRGRG